MQLLADAALDAATHQLLTGVLSIVVAAVGWIAGWALLKTITHGEKLSRMEGHMEDGNRRFNEINTKLDNLQELLLNALSNESKNDHPSDRRR